MRSTWVRFVPAACIVIVCLPSGPVPGRRSSPGSATPEKAVRAGCLRLTAKPLPLSGPVHRKLPSGTPVRLPRAHRAEQVASTDGVNALTERFGRADRKGQRAPGARSAGGVVDADDRQGGAVRRNSDRGSGPRPGYSDAIQARRSAASCRAGLDGDPSRAEAAICDPGAALEGLPTGECQGLWLLARLQALPWP
jgi:hypothetical protein